VPYTIEVHNCLSASKFLGKKITLHVKRRKPGAHSPWKYLGHGYCDNFSRSVVLTNHTNDPSIITDEVIKLYKSLEIPPKELRGIGIHLSQLSHENHVTSNNVTCTNTAMDVNQRPYSIVEYMKKSAKKHNNNNSNNHDNINNNNNNNNNNNSNNNILHPEKPSNEQKMNYFEFLENSFLFKKERFSEFQHLFNEWLISVKEPQIVHKELIQQMLEQYIVCRNLEDVSLMLKKLERFSEENNMWKNAFDEILTNTQNIVQIVYGCKLQF